MADVEAEVGGDVMVAIIEDRAGSVVVANSSPRTDILDACDCNASISGAAVVFSHRLRMLTKIVSICDCVSMPPFTMA